MKAILYRHPDMEHRITESQDILSYSENKFDSLIYLYTESKENIYIKYLEGRKIIDGQELDKIPNNIDKVEYLMSKIYPYKNDKLIFHAATEIYNKNFQIQDLDEKSNKIVQNFNEMSKNDILYFFLRNKNNISKNDEEEIFDPKKFLALNFDNMLKYYSAYKETSEKLPEIFTSGGKFKDFLRKVMTFFEAIILSIRISKESKYRTLKTIESFLQIQIAEAISSSDEESKFLKQTTEKGLIRDNRIANIFRSIV